MIPVAISPCPNDTFLFHAWIEGIVGKEMPPLPTFADIQQLNSLSLKKTIPLIKVSISQFAKLQKEYELLDVGCALGWNCGPKLVAKEGFSLKDWKKGRVAIPGRDTTAHHLMSHFLEAPKEKVFCLYHEVESLLQNGSVDAGLIIHETRFTHHYVELADFGMLWHERYGLPLPLGGVIVQRDFAQKNAIAPLLRASLDFAWKHPESSRDFILKHAISKDQKVIDQHISLYVNDETYALSSNGKNAIELLMKLCQ